MKTDGASENLKFLSNTKTIPVQDEFTMTEEVEFGNYGEEPMDSIDQFIEIVKKTTMCSDINIFTSNMQQVFTDYESICSIDDQQSINTLR